MVYQWCSVISEKMRGRGVDELVSEGLPHLQKPRSYSNLLTHSLAIAFRHIGSDYIEPVRLSHTPHHEWMLDAIFARGDDDVIADAVYAWIVDWEITPSGSCTRRLLKLTEGGRTFSPRLRQTIVRAIRGLWWPELEAAELEFVCLLNYLEVGMDDADNGWLPLLICVLLTPMGQEHLSSYYWLFVGNLISVSPETHSAEDRQIEIMKSLEEAQDWEKLETWMLIVWWSAYYSGPVPIQDIERATLTLFQRRPSAILKFEDLLEKHTQFSFPCPLFNEREDEFRRICSQARAEQPRLDSPL
jgi:hypothetical protein